MNAPKINLPDGLTDAERVTAMEAAIANGEGNTPVENVSVQVSGDVPESTVTKATQRTATSRWNITAAPYGVRAVHESGEVYYGDMAGFNAHIKG